MIWVARIFHTYGPRILLGDGRPLSNFNVQGLEGESITVYGDGTQTCSFGFVGDEVEGLVRLMDAGDEVAGPVNLGSRKELTVLECSERFRAAVGQDVRIEHRPLPQDDPRRRRADISLANLELGWCPETSLTDGLEATVAHFRSRLSYTPAAEPQLRSYGTALRRPC